ncbi:PREDICTED: P-loop NTPase domain-containing protein LPA1 homolog [Nelumbo nucifera]|uniref:P-loop NTPase domain-containing protein LPA1 homolog n=1 Tax=Nelumbo nucifera TaxID=4432 RepID=A0A1U8QCL7_NELNU|nr:PREDICTED: P-loop NTPase domain-containing protein LPA1 homolog [Nelumbo nucifera]XP_010279556.1 PREDICTED: P-loop NTPase domain-containing protein LPA1 homolog [Nelumbo nucifera]XP_010279557.1 PREDICTED: P-loop NTPase domain-containing protein LPA1 homolog [Nelumbo nucifera]XP_010279558.1 PREDICTED: P-loop NTPase domain-containing protein LPA1 homolog [Nelumbo nucifera]XP_019056030.1 PREDICTED: P-loop NTPase domain-containing protein LPA1 homolog [Nelumbo nucifera]XP_019056031.1 PREDICTED:
MAVRKLCYVIVIDDDNGEETEKQHRLAPGSCNDSDTSFWYTKSTLQSVLQLVGCKVHHAFKISRRVFDILENENLKRAVDFEVRGTFVSDGITELSYIRKEGHDDFKTSKGQLHVDMKNDHSAKDRDKPYDLYKKRVSATVKRGRFLDVICSTLEKYRYVGPSQCADIGLACRLREKKESVTILLCGTSGCGKSTLSSLLASRLGITTVVSTDSIRHMMRSFINEKENPLLWASTYHAGEFLDPAAVAEAKRKKDRKLSTMTWSGQVGLEKLETMPKPLCDTPEGNFLEAGPSKRECTKLSDCYKTDGVSNLPTEQVAAKVLAIEGYKAQSEMVIDSLDRLITVWEENKESVVVEGVHLSLNFVIGLMKKHPSIIPFLIYISDEEKHLERFAVRAKYMTLDPSKNKYAKYIKNIRTIQDYLCRRADKYLVPKVNNTNVDQSVAAIHSTIFSCLRRRQMGVSLYDMVTNTVKVINEEYSKHYDANSVSSKGMFRMIQRQGSLHHYMAIVNSDGSVSKAWPFMHEDRTKKPSSSSASTSVVGSPIYGSIQFREAEPVNIQFGNFGIGSWPNDTEGTSYTSSVNDFRLDGDEEVVELSSSSSSQLHHEGHLKELTEQVVASESEEEPLQDDDDNGDDDDDDDSRDAIFELGHELEGSVVESSTRSDDEYDIDLKDGMLYEDAASLEALSHPTSPFDGPRKHHKLWKCYSMKLSGKFVCEGKPFSRVNSLPLQRNHSNNPKRVNIPMPPTDA